MSNNIETLSFTCNQKSRLVEFNEDECINSLPCVQLFVDDLDYQSTIYSIGLYADLDLEKAKQLKEWLEKFISKHSQEQNNG